MPEPSPSSFPPVPIPAPPVWQVVTWLGTGQIVVWGILFYAFALLAPRIAAETGWSAPLVHGGFSLALLVTGLASPRVGRLVDAGHGRLVLTGGPVIGALALIGLASATSPAAYLAAMAGLGLAMAGSLYDPAFALLGRLYGRDARRAISAVTLFGGFASTLAWPLTQALLDAGMDWRGIAWIYAAALVLIAAPLHAAAARHAGSSPPIVTHDATGSPSDQDAFLPGNAPQSAAAQPDARQPHPPPPACAGAILILFGTMIALHGLVTSALSVHVVAALDTLGLTAREAVIAGMLIGPAQVLARLVEMLAGRALPALALGLIAAGLLPLAFAVLAALGTGLPAAMTFALVYGASNGLITIARGVVPLALFGPVGLGRRLGRIAGPALVMKAAAPAAFAALAATAGMPVTLAACAVAGLLSLVAMAGVAWLARPVRSE